MFQTAAHQCFFAWNLGHRNCPLPIASLAKEVQRSGGTDCGIRHCSAYLASSQSWL